MIWDIHYIDRQWINYDTIFKAINLTNRKCDFRELGPEMSIISVQLSIGFDIIRDIVDCKGHCGLVSKTYSMSQYLDAKLDLFIASEISLQPSCHGVKKSGTCSVHWWTYVSPGLRELIQRDTLSWNMESKFLSSVWPTGNKRTDQYNFEFPNT